MCYIHSTNNFVFSPAYAGYGKTVCHVVIGMKTAKGTKSLKLDPSIYESLQKEKVETGDVIYIEANSGAVKVSVVGEGGGWSDRTADFGGGGGGVIELQIWGGGDGLDELKKYMVTNKSVYNRLEYRFKGRIFITWQNLPKNIFLYLLNI